jgi:dUTPase
MEEKIKIKYHVKELEKLCYIDGKSDWIDLRVAEDVKMKAGEFRLISMGISVELPKGYEMWILPRSSAFKNFGVIQTNAMGVVDESFCGDNDIIHMPILAMRDTEMHINDRIGQFRIAKHQAEIHFVEVEHLNHADRGGFGTTGKS